MLAAIEGARRQILFETYIWKGDEVGERFKAALAARRTGASRSTSSTTASRTSSCRPGSSGSRPTMKVLRYPVYTAGLRFFDLRPLRPRPPQDPGRRRRGRVRRRLQHRGGLRHRVARHPRADHRARGLGPQAGLRGLLEPEPPQAARPERAAAAAGDGVATWEPQIRFHRNVPRLWMFPIRSMYLEAINRASRNIWMTHAYFIPDQDFVDAMKAAAGAGRRRPAAGAAQVQPHRGRLDLARLLRPAARRGVRIFRFRDAMVHAKTSTVDGTWSTVGTANVDRLSLQGNYEINVEVIDEASPRPSRRSSRSTSPTAWSSPAASGRPGTCTASSPSWCSRPCVRCSEPIRPG